MVRMPVIIVLSIIPQVVAAKDVYYDFSKEWQPGEQITNDNAIFGIREMFPNSEGDIMTYTGEITRVEQHQTTVTIYFTVEHFDMIKKEKRPSEEQSITCSFVQNQWLCPI